MNNHYNTENKITATPKTELNKKKIIRKNKRKIFKLEQYNAYNDGALVPTL